MNARYLNLISAVKPPIATTYSHNTETILSRTPVRRFYKLRFDDPAVLFYLSYTLWLIWKIISSSRVVQYYPQQIDKLMHLTTLSLLVLSELPAVVKRQSPRSLIWLPPILLVVVLVKRHVGASLLLDSFFFVCCARNKDINRILAITCYATAASCCVIVFASQIGLLEDYIFDPGNRERHGLGFSYCTFLSHYLLNAAIAWVVLRRDKLSAIEVAVFACIDFIVYDLTDARNSFVLTIALLLGAVTIHILHRRRVHLPTFYWHLTAWGSFIGLATISIVFFSLINPSSTAITTKLNSILGNRMNQTYASFQNYGISAFGQRISFAGNGFLRDGTLEKAVVGADTNLIDNSYMYVLFHYGYVLFSISLALFSIAGIRAAKRKDDYLCLALAILALHSFIDPQLLFLQYNVLIFFIYPRFLRARMDANKVLTANQIGCVHQHITDKEARTFSCAA